MDEPPYVRDGRPAGRYPEHNGSTHPAEGGTVISGDGFGPGSDRRSGQLAWRLAESISERVSRWKGLARVGRPVLDWFGKTVRPGPLKDILSGTWQGHPSHPMLTDIPIGAWTSAFF